MGLFKKKEDKPMVLNVDSESAMLRAFQNVQNRNEMTEILKELFEEKKIFMITDLSKDEIKLCTRIHTVAQIKKLKVWEDAIFFYAKIMLSRKRLSRREILDAIKGATQVTSMNKLNPFGRSG